MPKQKSPELKLGIELLSDGQVYSLSDFSAAVYKAITPQRAIKEGKARAGKTKEYSLGELIERGTKSLGNHAIRYLTRTYAVIYDENGVVREYWEEGDHSRWVVKLKSFEEELRWHPRAMGPKSLVNDQKALRVKETCTDEEAMLQKTMGNRLAVWERKLYLPTTYQGRPAAAIKRTGEGKPVIQAAYLTGEDENVVVYPVWPHSDSPIPTTIYQVCLGWRFLVPITQQKGSP